MTTLPCLGFCDRCKELTHNYAKRYGQYPDAKLLRRTNHPTPQEALQDLNEVYKKNIAAIDASLLPKEKKEEMKRAETALYEQRIKTILK